MRVIGICGSPRKGGNTELALKEALKEIEKQGIETELILLCDKKLNPCVHCNECKKGDCPQEDDVKLILKKLEDADGIVVASPTYFAQVSAQLKILMDRSLLLRRKGMKLRNKVGGAIAIGASRNGGQEHVCSAIQRWMLLHEMLVVADRSTAHFGGIGVGGHDRNKILKDKQGLKTIRNLGRKIAEVVLLTK
jgi:multimeric flavodoxin WrbA